MKRAHINSTWHVCKRSKRQKEQDAMSASDDGDNSLPGLPIVFPSMGAQKFANHIYFNDDITSESSQDLIHALREVEMTQRQLAVAFNGEPAPIYLHLTTNGGEIHAAFAVVDTINQLKIPVYTVVDGFVASAGTLISLSGAKRYISKNAYMLLHELRSGVWGKMSSIEEEMENLKKIMTHITQFYMEKTNLSRASLEKLLAKDVIWNAEECVKKGVADKVM